MTLHASTTWRDGLLARFTREIAQACRLTLASDPNGLLADDEVASRLRSSGFEIMTFEDPAAFRIAFETQIRPTWETGTSGVSLVVRTMLADPSKLPFDLVAVAERDARMFSFSIVALLPMMSPGPLAGLDVTSVEALYDAVRRIRPKSLGDDATRDFILRHVFDVDAEQISMPEDLLRVLLRKHYRDDRFPEDIELRLVEQLQRAGRWSAWPLERLVRNRSEFLQFIEERWPLFASAEAGVRPSSSAEMRMPGPIDLPFGDKDVRAYLDNMFSDGILARTDAVSQLALGNSWAVVGVRGIDGEDGVMRLRSLLPKIEHDLPSDQADHGDWLVFGRRWAEIVTLWAASRGQLSNTDLASKRHLEDIVDARFGEWLMSRFGGLHSRLYLPRPVMVHHIPHYLAHRRSQDGPGSRVAVIVVDGLSLDQWSILRRHMPTGLEVPDEHACFAWVPTLTSVSRQSIFAGEVPSRFPGSIHDTASEQKLWRRFWENHGLAASQVAFFKQSSGVSEEDFLDRLETEASRPFCRAVGVVLTTVDEMTHGAVLGTSQLHQDVETWALRGTFWNCVAALLRSGFDIVVTADHGNVEATGIGRPNVGALADTRGERVLIFSDQILRAQIAANDPHTIQWPSVGLPPTFLPLMAPSRKAFSTRGSTVVSHGGVSIEEVLVPLVEFRMKQ